MPVSLTPFSPRKDYLINRFPLSIHHSRHPQLTHSAVALPLTDRLQRVLNAAARVITGTRKFDRGLGQILHDQLHWLDVHDRVLFKLAVTVHRCRSTASRSPVPTRAGICVPPTVIYLPHAFPAQHLRPSGVFSCWPDGLELTPGFYPGSNEQHRLL